MRMVSKLFDLDEQIVDSLLCEALLLDDCFCSCQVFGFLYDFAFICEGSICLGNFVTSFMDIKCACAMNRSHDCHEFFIIK